MMEFAFVLMNDGHALCTEHVLREFVIIYVDLITCGWVT